MHHFKTTRMTMQQLTDVYGHCIIPKNTLLFRGHPDTSFDYSMFFATKHWVAGAFNDTIQVWKTITDIQVIFLVEYLDYRSLAFSALPQLYNSFFPADSIPNFDDLDIKQNPHRRNKLVRKLFDEYKIAGWLTSLENKEELELCLFDKQANSTQLQLLGTVDRGNKKYFKDSLARINIFPSKKFYDTTLQKLNEHALNLIDQNDHYKRYKRMINAWIKDEVRNGMDRISRKHFYLNLRTKLKI